jgi:uncharacterized protein (AIM24 family)
MQTKITGTILPVLQVGLEHGETVIATPGELSWMTASIQMRTTMNTAGNSGLWGAVKRAVTGGGLFMTEFSAVGMQGVVAFAARVPGGILPVEVGPGQSYMIHKHGFLCATVGVQLSTGFQRSLGAGVFGGDGFLLQRLTGPCTAWVELGGEIVSHDLAPGETLRVHPGHVGMFEERVGFDVVMMPGIKNALFGGDGLFLAQLTGPGRVWLQTMTLPNFAHALAPYLGQQQAQTTMDAGIGAGVAGAVLRDIFGRN